MKAIFKNFGYLFKRFRVPTLLNVAGLMLAFVAFIIILTQLVYEQGFEQMHSQRDRIYRLEYDAQKQGYFFPVLSRGLIESVTSTAPGVETGAIIQLNSSGSTYVVVSDGSSRNGYKIDITVASPTIVDVFDFQIIDGGADCLGTPNHALIPASMAKRLFGTTYATGKQIALKESVWGKSAGKELFVGGVYKDFPNNTQLNNTAYTAISNENMNDWYSQNAFCYLLLSKGADPQKVISEYMASSEFTQSGLNNSDLMLRSLTSLYYTPVGFLGQFVKNGNPYIASLLLAIAIIVLLIAVVNFTNFSMTIVPERIRTFNVRKVYGASDQRLRLLITTESIIISFIAFILALVLVLLIDSMKLVSLVGFDTLSLSFNYAVFFAFIAALLIGVLAGVFPAFRITSQSPAESLKGKVSTTQTGFKMRTLLVGFQFTCSILLILSAIFINKQNHFMKKFNLGFNTDQVLIVPLPQEITKSEYQVKLKDNPDILDIAYANGRFGASDSYSMMNFTKANAPDESEQYNPRYIYTSWNFLKLMGIQVLEGEGFSESDSDGDQATAVVNKRFQQYAKLRPGLDALKTSHQTYPIVGIVDDLQITSLRMSSDIFMIIQNNAYEKSIQGVFSFIKVKAGADMPAVLEYIKRTLNGFEPTFPVEIEFYDQLFADLYKQENETAANINFFSILAILISLIGVFGLVMLECKQRRKEIGVRKVLGSTDKEIVQLFYKTYIRTFIISFAISVPFVIWIMQAWLERFVNKTPLSWWVFLVGGLLVLLVVVLTASLESWRAARLNPIESLKSE